MSEKRIKFNLGLNVVFFMLNAFILAMGRASVLTFLCMAIHTVLVFYLASKLDD